MLIVPFDIDADRIVLEFERHIFCVVVELRLGKFFVNHFLEIAFRKEIFVIGPHRLHDLKDDIIHEDVERDLDDRKMILFCISEHLFRQGIIKNSFIAKGTDFMLFQIFDCRKDRLRLIFCEEQRGHDKTFWLIVVEL